MAALSTGHPNQARPATWSAALGRSPPGLEDDSFTDEDDLDLPLLQRDPLPYFLTPATPGDEDDEFQFDFDAGIEDVSKPQEMVRSVSPSTLDGLKKYKAARSKSASCAIIDGDDDEDDYGHRSDGDEDEQYMYFRPSKASPLGFPDFGIERPKTRRDRTRAGSAPLSPRDGGEEESYLSSPQHAFHVGSPRGRPGKPFTPPPPPTPSPLLLLAAPRPSLSHGMTRGRTRSAPLLRHRHSWREPSPDVWSIEEEPEKETMSETGMSVEDLEAYFRRGDAEREKTAPIDIPAAKPKKKVRFVLPEKESSLL